MNAAQRRVLSASLIIGLFVVWEVICDGFRVSDLVLPPPSEIFATLWDRYPAIWPHALQTLYTTLLGIFFGVIVGVLLGVSKLAYDVATRCWWASHPFPKSNSCRSWCCGSAPGRFLQLSRG